MKINKSKLLTLGVLIGATVLRAHCSDSDQKENFLNPPDNIRPAVYWYWLNDNISIEGAIKDLDAMKEIGIGTAFIGNIGNQDGDFGSVPFNSDYWWKAMRASLKRAGELNIDIGIFNSPGWSQSGGPWITPERSMRYLSGNIISVNGPQKIKYVFENSPEYFQPVKTIAYKYNANVPKAELDLAANAKVSLSPDFKDVFLTDKKSKNNLVIDKPLNELVINYALDSEITARTLTLQFEGYTQADADFYAKIDGKYKLLKSFKINRMYHRKLIKIVGFIPFADMVLNFEPTKAKEFRLVLKNIPEAVIKNISVSPRRRLELFAEKTLAKMHPNPAPTWDSYLWQDSLPLDDKNFAIDPANVIDLTLNIQDDGSLLWDVPEGEWFIVQMGMRSTGVTNNPASGAARGLEVDKMSKEHIAFHFNSYMGEILRRIPFHERRTFKYAVQDSYETGSLNWTDTMLQDFKTRYGYDPVKFFPVLYGEIVGTPEISDRFLWDLRRLIADKVAYDYVAGFREVAHKNGIYTWLENYGHWGFPAEFLQYGSQSDFVSGEFWNEGLGTVENRAASSCVHIYNKGRVWSESFTAAGKYFERSPADLKRRGDIAYTEGVNQTLLHFYLHQPYEDKTPGLNAWFSVEFNRKNTWFYQMKPFITYLRRCMYILQQGQDVSDIAYFIGEDTPKMTGICQPALPYGYNFDFINADVIRNKLSVKNGRLVLPHGTSYKLLVIPPQVSMTPETIKKLKILVDAGANILGPRPIKSPSLQGFPECDDVVKKTADEIWFDVDGDKTKYRKHHDGIVASNMSITEVFNLVGVPPDFGSNDSNLRYVHRSAPDKEIYFVCNTANFESKNISKFRITGKVPELWDALTGEVRPLKAFEVKPDGYTYIPLKLEAYGSAFIIFKDEAREPVSNNLEDNFPTPKLVTEINSNWSVNFLDKKIGEEKPVLFKELTDWSKSENPKIKFYSGTAVYTNTFSLKSKNELGKILINLGKVADLAEIKINGEFVGGVWTPPYQLDITEFAKSGENTIEVKLVNTWVNRLVADSALPKEERTTWLLVEKFTPDTPLKTSGLLGPVKVLSLDK